MILYRCVIMVAVDFIRIVETDICVLANPFFNDGTNCIHHFCTAFGGKIKRQVHPADILLAFACVYR